MPKSEKFPEGAGTLEVRNARLADAPAIVELTDKVYRPSGQTGYLRGMIEGQIRNFPEGQFVVCHGDRIIGYCATFIVDGAMALGQHSWHAITGGGYASRHDPDGDYLYGMEVCVDPEYRGYRIGQRLYTERKKLCQDWGLKGIVFGGRIPSLRRRLRKVGTVEDYIQGVQERRYRDPVLMFQLRNGFEIIGVLKRYDPEDRESMGCAAHMLWRNPRAPEEGEVTHRNRYVERLADSVRVATVQYMQRRVSSFEEFLGLVEYFIDVASDYRADFVTLPEMFSLQLLSMEGNELEPYAAIEALSRHTPALREFLRDAAMRYNVNIIGGSHPTHVTEDRIENVCFVCLRDGTVHTQSKVHPTPDEVYWWKIQGCNDVNVFETDCGPIGVLICYDSEFPELARRLADQGALILFVPFCTDERQGYLRVRYCCQARAVENQCYVVMSGNVGNLPRVANMDIQYAQSCILTPCDFAFSRDGVAADTTPNVETVAFADLRLEDLRQSRRLGVVRNLRDRRHDLYRVQWFRE